MNPSEFPNEPRAVPFTPVENELERRLSDVKIRYVGLPTPLDRSHGPRNLAWGIIFMVIGVIVAWLSHYFAEQNAALTLNTATLTLLSSLGTFLLLWIFYSLRLFRQRHGVFLALGLVTLLGASAPFLGQGYRRLDQLARTRLAVAERKQAEAAQMAALTPTAAAAPASTSQATVKQLVAPAPDPKAGAMVRLRKDTQVMIEGQPWLAKEGDSFPLAKFSDGMVTFKTGDDQVVSLPAESVVFMASKKASAEEAKAISARATAEAIKRYPALAERGSDENEFYAATQKELVNSAPDFFKNPEWPLNLAELIAKREGWQRADTGPLAEPVPVEAEDSAPKEGDPSVLPQLSGQ